MLLWQDPWIGGLMMGCIAPAVKKMVHPAAVLNLSVAAGWQGNAWVRDIGGILSIDATLEFLKLWEAVRLSPPAGGEDSFRWKWTGSGSFTARTAYHAFFYGRTTLLGTAQLWNAFAPLKFKVFGWLALRDRCWSADRMARHGMNCHSTCQLCGIEDATLNHILLQCHCTCAIWFRILQRWQWAHLTPAKDNTISDGWPSSESRIRVKDRRRFNSLVLLVARSLWLQHNARVFDRDEVPAHTLLELLDSEWLAWLRCRRGTSGYSEL
jgi:hypothetical protein